MIRTMQTFGALASLSRVVSCAGCQPGATELFPKKYNDRSELKFTVVKGKNKATFDLRTDSEE